LTSALVDRTVPGTVDARELPLDGRLARSARTFFSVVDALLGLIQEGNLRPTAAQVAERAGVSRRSVYLHFENIEALLAAAADRHAVRTAELWLGPSSQLPLDERIDELVRRWAVALEEVSPVRRAVVLHRDTSAGAARYLRLAREAAVSELERVFAPELRARDPHARAELLNAIEMSTSWSMWEQLRRQQGLPVDDAAAVVARMLRCLFRS
jgi:TetR/AcrR family transcriptional regulator, regulator of autoinduction and epiphytic fitness